MKLCGKIYLILDLYKWMLIHDYYDNFYKDSAGNNMQNIRVYMNRERYDFT